MRLAIGSDGQVTLDIHNQLPGRGAYLCADGTDCLAQAQRRRALSRSLRVGAEVIDYEALSATLGTLRQEVQTSPR